MQIIFFHMPKVAGESLRKVMPDGTLFYGHDYYHKDAHHLYYDVEKYMQKFVIAFVRNPYDRVVSAFHYLNAGGNNESDKKDSDVYIKEYNGNFDDFVKGSFLNFPYIQSQIHFMEQYLWIYHDNVNLCNFIGKYETIQEDIEKLSQIIDLKSTKVPLLNTSKHKHYEEYYTPETKKIIYECYEKDFKLFGYEA